MVSPDSNTVPTLKVSPGMDFFSFRSFMLQSIEAQMFGILFMVNQYENLTIQTYFLCFLISLTPSTEPPYMDTTTVRGEQRHAS